MQVRLLFVCLVFMTGRGTLPQRAEAQSTDSGRLAGANVPVGTIASTSNRTQSDNDTSRRLLSPTTSIARIVSVNYRIDERSSLGLSTELMKLASFYVRLGLLEQEPEWKFRGVPITLSYERILGRPDRRVKPVMGIGLSYYLTRMKLHPAADAPAGESELRALNSTGVSGMGWGAQATFGLRTALGRDTFLDFKVRYRLVDGLSLYGMEQLESEARFGVLDFAIGLGFDL